MTRPTQKEKPRIFTLYKPKKRMSRGTVKH